MLKDYMEYLYLKITIICPSAGQKRTAEKLKGY